MVNFAFLLDPIHCSTNLGWSGSLLLQTEAAQIGDYGRKQINNRYVLYMTPLKKKTKKNKQTYEHTNEYKSSYMDCRQRELHLMSQIGDIQTAAGSGDDILNFKLIFTLQFHCEV